MIIFTKCAAAVLCTVLLSAAASEAAGRKTCSATPPAKTYWSWRQIDGRKCWYEGKAGLSKSLLKWPDQVAARYEAAPRPARRGPPGKPLEAQAIPGDLLDAQASALEEPASFDARWQARVGGLR
jgi:hypothetical protein